ncbi:MAG TPA: Gfo/Idh/MocA family oxidoreductase [Solirubrobacterales bacterium]|nr:Gfo/Idh/MocA family oxidoreductase [Solirubrobacterales bacterium]
MALLKGRRRVAIGLAGVGYWGSNVARNLARIPACELLWCCDTDVACRERASSLFPDARFSQDFEELLADESLDAVAIATPVPTHAAMAERAIEAGKHCFVEKPLAQSAADAERVAALAEERGVVLMVGHLLEFHPGVEALRELIATGELGELHYIYSQRLNLGKLRADENALWSLGAHDVSTFLNLTRELPLEVSAHGESYVREGVEDVVFGHLRFPSGMVAHMHLSWLDPHKERRLTVVGSQRMAVFDDMATERKLTVFDKGFDQDVDSRDAYVTRSGGARSPAIVADEPLWLELEHFVECAREGSRPHSDGASGVRVVRVLEALQLSLEAGGVSVALGAPSAARP